MQAHRKGRRGVEKGEKEGKEKDRGREERKLEGGQLERKASKRMGGGKRGQWCEYNRNTLHTHIKMS